MITIIKQFNIYRLYELDERAKEKAIKNYLEYYYNSNIEVYNNYLDFEISDMFPNSDIKYQYDLSCSQGSGFNLYGFLSVVDACELLNLSIEDINRVNSLADSSFFEIPYNNKYTYSTAQFIDVGFDCCELTGEDFDFFNEFIFKLIDRIDSLNSTFYNASEEYVNNPDFEHIEKKEWFYKDGRYFVEGEDDDWTR